MPDLRFRLERAALRTAMSLPPRVQRVLAGRPVVRDGHRLSTEMQLSLALQRLGRVAGAETLPLPQGREALVRHARLAGGRQPIGALRNLTVDGGDGPLPARLYVPSSRLGAAPAPTMLFLHGGGWVYGDLESHDAACRFLAERSGVQLLALDYRLAPEHPYPAAVQDCRAAYRWLVEHADDANADPARLAVGGDSAGGNLAAVTAVHAAEHDLPCAFQLLIYPGTDFVERRPSRRALGEGFYLTEAFMQVAEDAYFPEVDRATPPADRANPPADRAKSRSTSIETQPPADRAKSRSLVDPAKSDPDASPLRREEFPPDLAPAHVVTAGFDPLRDEGQAYAEHLRRHGVHVTTTFFPGLIHGFLNIVGVGRETPSAVAEIAARLAQALIE